MRDYLTDLMRGFDHVTTAAKARMERRRLSSWLEHCVVDRGR